MGSLVEGGSSRDLIKSENVQWSQHNFADRWNVDGESEANILGLSNQKG